MAAPAGATVRGYSPCPEYSEIFPADTYDFGRSILDGRHTVVDKVMPRWGGHGLSWPLDSGICLSTDGRTQGSGLGRFDQSTFRPTNVHRVNGPYYLFGPGCSDSGTPVT